MKIDTVTPCYTVYIGLHTMITKCLVFHNDCFLGLITIKLISIESDQLQKLADGSAPGPWRLWYRQVFNIFAVWLRLQVIQGPGLYFATLRESVVQVVESD